MDPKESVETPAPGGVIPIGRRVPDLLLRDARGGTVSLRAFDGEATALIFLRHLG